MGVLGKVIGGESQGVTAYVSDVGMRTAGNSTCLSCGENLLSFKSRCNPDCVLDA